MVEKFLPQGLKNKLKLILAWKRLRLARKSGICNLSFPVSGKVKVLFYDLTGLSYGGTQKSLQILAKHLDKSIFEVYYMYSQLKDVSRLSYLQVTGVNLIPFKHGDVGGSFPFYIHNMHPHIFKVIGDNKINILVTPGSGYPEYPTANITSVPTIQINIFGSINTQPNIVKYLCISNYLTERIKAVLPKRDIETLYILSEGPGAEAADRGLELRRRLGLDEKAFVFGRIGRPDDNIFDPIGILAFEKVVKKYPRAHYLIMAPPPALEKLVSEQKIPNVHFLPPTGDEGEVWAFHNAIDVLGHFRRDGETLGLNIVESMLCGKPIISHKSIVWNAHLEYLDDSFSRVADIDNIDEYEKYMEYFVNLSETERKNMGQLAKQKAEQLFLVKNNIAGFEQILKEAVSH